MKIKPVNKVCEPTKPKKAEAKATKCLAVMLVGGVINRKTLGDLGIASYNDSAHSLISILRNEQLIPIESLRQEDGPPIISCYRTKSRVTKTLLLDNNRKRKCESLLKLSGRQK